MLDDVSPLIEVTQNDLGIVDIEEMIAREMAKEVPPAPTGNGGPPLDEHPGKVVARIGHACYGERWHGKLAADVGEDHRTVRRWELGECRPSPLKVARIETVARAHIARIQRALEKR
ncbi:hypothetical protein MKK58_17675 [Methylobacterium sp. J-078]|uniref:hypothetical protein n=1 Tax=Methylobacterium sp. J-078 TaxID=2836657 RepID=UPI001FB8F209|nr:hypothetical protein [Methylobacterium sp. J-078]MCJ2046348.1 hypothetical protein [Methylobacterium sp. J-078]